MKTPYQRSLLKYGGRAVRHFGYWMLGLVVLVIVIARFEGTAATPNQISSAVVLGGMIAIILGVLLECEAER